LFVVGISALIALSRGLVKEVLSIIGWVLGTASVIYLLPIVIPFAKQYIDNGYIAGTVSSICILVLFFIIWIYTTSSIVGKIRTSKLNGLDRFLGLFFGIMRAFLLVVLFNIMINWVVPTDKQSDLLAKSKYYQTAGKFAKPLESMIPQETLKLIKDQTIVFDGDKEDKKEPLEEKDESQILFEKLSQPKVKNASERKNKDESKGYKETEREDLDRLIESVE
jgi:membrane protein required for colicin V production